MFRVTFAMQPGFPFTIETAMRRISLALLLTLATGAASAQSYLSPDPPPNSIEDRFRLEFDLFYGSYSTELRLDDVRFNPDGSIASITPGTQVSGEDDFGLDESQLLAQVELTLLPGKHHMIRLNGLSMRREGSAILTRNIRWDESIYRVNERVDSYLNLSMVGLTYGYLPIRRDGLELGVSFGIQIASFSTNAEVRSRSIREEESAVGPVPLIGVEARYDFTPRWSIDGRVQYLSLGFIESYDGAAHYFLSRGDRAGRREPVSTQTRPRKARVAAAPPTGGMALHHRPQKTPRQRTGRAH